MQFNHSWYPPSLKYVIGGIDSIDISSDKSKQDNQTTDVFI